MNIPIYQVSAFSNGPFTGNPAAVCPLDEWLPTDTMQSIAAENNLSETAFFMERGDDGYDLRWFTPTVEVDLCGHATLASGHVVLNILRERPDSTVFHTRSGELTVTRNGDLLSLDLPVRNALPVDDPALSKKLASLLEATPVTVMDAGLPVVLLDSESEVAKLELDPGRMLASGFQWLSVTAPGSDDETDFVSRYFAPGSGISEDPVTGSAHAWLTPLWAKKLGKTDLNARQISRRGGWLRCARRGERVVVSGAVENYLAGEISLA